MPLLYNTCFEQHDKLKIEIKSRLERLFYTLSGRLRITFTNCSTKPHTGGSNHLS